MAQHLPYVVYTQWALAEEIEYRIWSLDFNPGSIPYQLYKYKQLFTY